MKEGKKSGGEKEEMFMMEGEADFKNHCLSSFKDFMFSFKPKTLGQVIELFFKKS